MSWDLFHLISICCRQCLCSVTCFCCYWYYELFTLYWGGKLDSIGVIEGFAISCKEARILIFKPLKQIAFRLLRMTAQTTIYVGHFMWILHKRSRFKRNTSGCIFLHTCLKEAAWMLHTVLAGCYSWRKCISVNLISFAKWRLSLFYKWCFIVIMLGRCGISEQCPSYFTEFQCGALPLEEVSGTALWAGY